MIQKTKSPSIENRKLKTENLSPQHSNFSATFNNSKDDSRKILTSAELRRKTENFKKVTADIYHKKLIENQNKLKDF